MRTKFYYRRPTLERIAAEIIRCNGITINWRNTRMERPQPEERFIVGIGSYFERQYRVGSAPGVLRVTDCLADYIGHTLLAEPDIDCEGYWLGAWIDERVLYLDVCRTYYDRFDAEKAAERAQQFAYYDAELDEAVAV